MKTEPQVPVSEQEAYAVFHMEMKILHRPELPVHYDVVERATQLRWQFRNVHNWKSQFFRSLKDAVDLDARPSAGEAKHFAEILEILLRHNILEKIAKHEAALGEQLRKSDQDLRDLADWRIVNGLKRGDIGYQVSHRLDWDKVIHHDVLPPEAG